MSQQPNHRDRLRVSTLIAALALVASLSVTAPAGARLHGNPMAKGPWFVDLHWNAAARSSDPRIRRYIGSVPMAEWVVESFTRADVAQYVQRVREEERRPGSMAMFAVHGLPHAACGNYDGGGPAGARKYRKWVRGIAAGIGRAKAIVFLEPDGVAAAAECMQGGNLARRLSLIRYAVGQFAKRPNVGTYIDAGTSDWRPAGQMARMLRKAGIRRARGFALNVTHYDWTWNQLRYGDRISRATGGKHFVVNTAYNGRGPLYKAGGTQGEVWCDPPGRALGPVPTLKTGDRRADAFFWIGNPGIADNCGHYHAGQWVPAIARSLIRNARRRGSEYPRYRRHHGRK